MKLDKDKILSPNTEFERRQELTRLLKEFAILTERDHTILKSCATEDHESIGIIGCLLKDNSNINNARLIIASLNESNIELANSANSILNLSESELNILIDKLANLYILKTDEISIYEDKIYGILFGILSNQV